MTSWGFPATLTLLAATVATVWWTGQAPAENLAAPLESIALRIGGWAAIEDDQPVAAPVFKGIRPSAYLEREYRRDGEALNLFVAYYSRQRAGEGMHSPRNCLPGGGWEIRERHPVWVDFQGRKVEINRLSIQNGGQKMAAYYWYQSRRRIVADEYLGKVMLARDAILRQGTAGSLARIIVPDTPRAAGDAVGFAAEIMTQLERCLGSTSFPKHFQ